MSDFFKKSIFLGGLTAIIAAVFVGGVYLGYNQRPEVNRITELFNKEAPSQQSQFDFAPFWKTWNLIDSYYVSKSDIDKQKFVWGAIQGLVASLDDPYSVFLSPQEAEMFQSSVRGDFEGVGMEIGIKDKILTVISALKNTPAERAGIKSGDKIIVYTKPGDEGSKTNKSGNESHFFYWDLEITVWNKDEDCAIIVKVDSYKTKRIST